MEANHHFTDWRELLGHVMGNTQEKRRLAHELGVRPVTLQRWVAGEVQPRDENVRHLISAFSPSLAPLFLSLIEKDFPDLARTPSEHERGLSEFPLDVYAQVMQAYVQKPATLARDALYELIFPSSLEYLDPDGLGMSLVLLGCVPPLVGQRVRSLRQIRGMGTPPWERNLERRTIFLGSESVAGSAVMNAHATAIGSRTSSSFTPANWTDHEQSAIASPILRRAHIAGALLASSTQPNYFTAHHRHLLDLYAHLVMLMFDTADFYAPEQIVLGVMPSLAQQLPYFANFPQRVALKFEEAALNRSAITLPQAHQHVWQDIEEELLRVASEE